MSESWNPFLRSTPPPPNPAMSPHTLQFELPFLTYAFCAPQRLNRQT